MEVYGASPPILFHPLKHHLGWIRSFMAAYYSFCAEDNLELMAKLRTIGRSQMDLYTGTLDVPDVAGEILAYLHSCRLHEKVAYKQWLDQGAGYQSVSLSDQSSWVLRWGTNEGRYVHIHPARYSPHTIRVKAGALRTAIAIRIALKQNLIQAEDVFSMNQIRKEWLDLPPVKSLPQTASISRLLPLLE